MLDNIKAGFGVWYALDLFHTKEWGSLYQTTSTGHGETVTWKGRGECFIDLSHFTFVEERRIVAPGFGVMRKHHNSGSFPINTMDRDKVVKLQSFFQADQEGFTKKSTRGHDRQKMGLVRHQDMVILIKNAFLERNWGFPFQLAVVKNKGPSAAGTLGA
jgi:hypothetical protein